ncbi:hypothetical protein QE152_g28510 [Popillia japonica]|uniref:Uncharacterized protein n=1 Tax=Popillia japonica TaxID=7064 RepID=A0AAW1JK42_POPJA
MKCVPLSELKKQITEQNIISNVQQSFNKCVELCNADHATLMEDFMNLDDDVITSETPTENEIVASVSKQNEFNKNSDVSDTEDILREKPSHHEMAKSFETIHFLINMTEKTMDDVFVLVDKVKQMYESECVEKTLREKLTTDYSF